GSDAIRKEDVLEWMHEADLLTKAAVYQLTDRAWSRIQPEISRAEQCDFMAAYLLECLAGNVQNDAYIHSGFEAAWEIAAWLKHLVSIPDAERTIAAVAH